MNWVQTDKTAFYDVTCMGKYNAYGQEVVECVPFIKPDGIFGMCIHASIWICLKVLENRHIIAKCMGFSIPEIQNLATGCLYNDAQGLKFVQASRLLRMCRTAAVYINNKEANFTDNKMIKQIYAYVAAKLPVIIGVDTSKLKWWKTGAPSYHTLVVIGYTMTNGTIDGFIVHDESALPYQVMTIDELKNAWYEPKEQKDGHENIQKELQRDACTRELLVAVPREVSLPFHEVNNVSKILFSEMYERKIIDHKIDTSKISPMLVRSRSLYVETNIKCLHSALVEADFPKYVWGIWFKDKNNQTTGLYVRDATMQTDFMFSYVVEKEMAIYRLDGKTYRRCDNTNEREEIEGTIK
ncbi:MAG: hypothetical protein LBQ98_08385 [Nitrososphaerota archaeon]|jgi:hypothetical protein|nr:hypothetical protein [Nitrososphaerota archaeon]